jgi:hypothetical protein
MVWDGTGYLSPGRERCTLEEAHAALVASSQFERSTTRAEIWDHWRTTVEMLRELVGHVCCAWLGGSFTSSKLDPDDIDSVFVVESTRLEFLTKWADR